MDRPTMNEARMRACMKRGRTRAQCMKEVYPEGEPKTGGKKKGGGKKAPPFKKGGY